MIKAISNFKFPISKTEWKPAVVRGVKIGNRQLASAELPAQPGLASGNVSGFTLLELLVVITIVGILAALTAPALKSLGRSNVQVSATRQLLDHVARARQLAISRRATVYMVYVPTNFFNLSCFYNNKSYPDFSKSYQDLFAGLNDIASAPDKDAAFQALSNAVALQLTGYNFVSFGNLGDQPGQHRWHYLSDWQTLPEGSFIPPQKFPPQSNPLSVPQWQTNYAGQIDNWIPGIPQIYPFSQAWVPFPTENSPFVQMPCLVFDFQGRLISETDGLGNYHHAYIPLAQGTVDYGMDQSKQPQFTIVQPSGISENPPGNSTNISYNIIDINPQTGRATLQHFKVQ